MKKLTGFTILETLITLIITCSLLMVGTLKLKDYQSEIILNNTIKEVIAEIECAGRETVIRHRKIGIIYDPKTLGIQFRNGYGYNHILRKDERVEVAPFVNFNISPNGMISPQTLVFRNDNRIKKVKIQMVWGRVIYAY